MNSRWLFLSVLLLTVAALGACGVLDFAFGVKTNPQTGETAPTGGPAPVDILGTLIPGLAGILSLVRWGYSEIRVRKLDKSVKATIVGITEIVDAKLLSDEQKTALYKTITEASKILGNMVFFEELVARIKDEYRSIRVSRDR